MRTLRAVLALKLLDLDRTRGSDGFTALHWACRAGHASCALALLEAGASVDEQVSTRDVPPAARSEKGTTSAARTCDHQPAPSAHQTDRLSDLLLEAMLASTGFERLPQGAHGGGGPAEAPSAEQAGEAAEVAGVEGTPRPLSARVQTLEELMIAAEAEVAALTSAAPADGAGLPRGWDGCTALMIAAAHRHAGVVRALISATPPAHRLIKDGLGRTALDHARDGGSSSVLQLLGDGGAGAASSTPAVRTPPPVPVP